MAAFSSAAATRSMSCEFTEPSTFGSDPLRRPSLSMSLSLVFGMPSRSVSARPPCQGNGNGGLPGSVTTGGRKTVVLDGVFDVVLDVVVVEIRLVAGT